MGNLLREKSGRWTMRVGIKGKRYCRSTRMKDRDQAERFLQRFLAPFCLSVQRPPPHTVQPPRLTPSDYCKGERKENSADMV